MDFADALHLSYTEGYEKFLSLGRSFAEKAKALALFRVEAP